MANYLRYVTPFLGLLAFGLVEKKYFVPRTKVMG
jgi:hypothetical protein